MGEAVFLKPCTRKPGSLTGADRGLLTFRSSHDGVVTQHFLGSCPSRQHIADAPESSFG